MHLPTALYIIRHAQPASQEPDYSGGPNPPLGSNGQEQARLTAQQMADWGIDVLYSSTMARALETAQPIYDELAVAWHVWPAFCEVGRGRWPELRTLAAQAATGTENPTPTRPIEAPLDPTEAERYLPLSRLHTLYPDILLSQPFPWPDNWWRAFQDETREAAYARVDQAIGALWDQHRGSEARIALVCHGALASVLLTILTQGPPCDYNRFSHAHAAITRVDLYDEGFARLRFQNYTSHMPVELVTDGVFPRAKH